MPIEPQDAISPLDGRYAAKLTPLRDIFSEAGLMRARAKVECAWLLALGNGPAAGVFESLAPPAGRWLRAMTEDASLTEVGAIKAIESRTNHDVKAVEYWLREALLSRGATGAQVEWVHFGCTSEDINNLAYALMLKSARAEVLLPEIAHLTAALETWARRYADVPMLARTHGQIATPTTVGKEFRNVAARLQGQAQGLAAVHVRGKMNGAVGNFNAHIAALPRIDWRAVSAAFIESLGLESNPYTTQIEPHDWIAEYCHALIRINTVLLDFARDVWGYIALGYLKQKPIAAETGSSTMPHKVNPIDFENAEGNIGIANALLGHFAEKLPISRWQRDLSDSTVLRNCGVALGHSYLAYRSLQLGISKIELDEARCAADLEQAWEVLGEAIQTVMRAHGIKDGYDRLKEFSRGRAIDKAMLQQFISALELPPAAKQALLQLTPASYVGLAGKLARGET
jgi:adenylosuccinate lyase